MNQLLSEDRAIANAIFLEQNRQIGKLEMIASENFVSSAVMEAVGSVLTNKYAEGYPEHRYYGGCEFVDTVEQLAIDRAKEIFKCSYANVQPHSGSQANMAAYFSLINPGDTVMGMELSQGGHLTHGSPVNFSGRMYNFVSYGVDPETGIIDYDAVEKIAEQCNPSLIVAGASAYPRVIDFARFRQIADKVGAKLMVDMAHIAGLVAADEHPSPIPYANVTTTTTHKTLRGPRGGIILSDASMAKIINSQIFPGLQGGPLMHIIAGKAVCLAEALRPKFKQYQKQVKLNAATLAECLNALGYNLVTGGTDNHLILVNLTNKGITGKEAEKALDIAGITVNKNSIPHDPLPPYVTSGLRIGTPALTTRGMKEEEMLKVAVWIDVALNNAANPAMLDIIRNEVESFAWEFPLFAW